MLFSNMTLNPQPLHIDRHFCETETEWGQPLMNSLFTLGPDDRDFGLRHHRRHDHRQSRHDGSEVSASAVRERHRPLHDAKCSASASRSRVPAPASSSFTTAPTIRTTSSSPSASGRRSCGCGRRNNTEPHALVPVRSRRQRQANSTRACRAAPMRCIIDLEDSVAADAQAAARETALRRSCAAHVANTNRPRLIVRVNAPRLRPDRCRPRRCRCRGGPTRSCCRRPKAAPSVVHARRQADRARSAARRCPRARSRSSRSRPKPRRRCFVAGTYRGASPRLIGLTWGAEDLSADLGAEANRDAGGGFLDPYRLARTLCLAGASVGAGAGDRHGLCRTSATTRA